MKNKTKIILSGLAALLSIAYLVCSIVIPAETMEFMNKVGVILNYPITIAGVSMTIGGIAAYFLVNVILKTTKFGRKELDNIKKDNEEFKASVENTINEGKKNVQENNDEYNKLQNNLDEMLNNSKKDYEHLEELVLSALEVVPNKKIRAKVKEYRDEKATNTETKEE